MADDFLKDEKCIRSCPSSYKKTKYMLGTFYNDNDFDVPEEKTDEEFVSEYIKEEVEKITNINDMSNSFSSKVVIGREIDKYEESIDDNYWGYNDNQDDNE